MPIFLVLLLLVFSLSSVGAQSRPLQTERVMPVERGRLRLEIGVEHQWARSYSLSGLKGDLTRIGAIALRWGAGEIVEIQAHGVIQDFFRISESWQAPHSERLEFSGDRTNDFGDLMLATKFILKREGAVPAVGFRFGVELPNAQNESGLGSDETNAFAEFLFQKSVFQGELLGALGFAILGDPLTAAAQDDVVTYGIGMIYPLHTRLNAVAETTGRFGDTGLGTEPRAIVRLGTQIRARGLFWDTGVLFGFRQTDASFGLSFGLSRTL
jgi:hypothetical protein